MSLRASTFITLVAIAIAVFGVYLAQPSWVLDAVANNATRPSEVLLSTAHDPIRNVTYVGSTSTSRVDHFQNIFYAEDTSGHNRFHAPKPIQPLPGSVINATQAGAWCPQGTGSILPFSSYIDNISENCLSLRVSRPSGYSAGADLPVMVWIFSGGHALGSAYEKLYDPDALVAQSIADGQPIVYVAMNYRVGIFGFAMTDALLQQNNTNLGIRDQRAAFEWVKRNIRHFGGDPERVTAFGHSVGGLDIGLHLVSYGGAGVPFQRAIMLSGATGLSFNMNSDFAKQATSSVALKLDCINGDEGQSDATIECLRSVPMEQLINVSVAEARTARPVFGELYRSVVVDNDLFLDRPSELIRAGKVAKDISLVLSWDTNDGAWYPSPTTTTDEDVVNSFKLWLFNLSDETARTLLELYPVAEFAELVRPGVDGPATAQYYRAARISRDIWFTCPALDFAWQYQKHGSNSSDNVYLYQGNATRYAPIFDMMGVPFWRVSHLSSIPYVFNTQTVSANADNSAEQLAMAKLVSSSLVHFAAQGDPAKSRSVVQAWPAAFAHLGKEDFSLDHATSMTLQVFGGPEKARVVSVGDGVTSNHPVTREKLLERCEFLNSEGVRAEIGA